MDTETLKKEFGVYGEVVFARVVKDLEGNSKGYGFVEFSSYTEFLAAFRQASNRRIKDKPIFVDAEIGRINKQFRPTRLGGGLGRSRRTKGKRYQR